MPAVTIFENYLGGHAMPNGELAHIAVLQVGHALVPVAAAQTAEIRPGHERLLAGHLDLRLKGERLVTGIVGGWPPPIDQKDRNRSRAGRQAAFGAIAVDRPHGKGQPQSFAGRNILLQGLLGLIGQVEHDLLLAWRSLPLNRSSLPLLRLLKAIVAPTHRHRQLPSA